MRRPGCILLPAIGRSLSNPSGTRLGATIGNSWWYPGSTFRAQGVSRHPSCSLDVQSSGDVRPIVGNDGLSPCHGEFQVRSLSDLLVDDRPEKTDLHCLTSPRVRSHAPKHSAAPMV